MSNQKKIITLPMLAMRGLVLFPKMVLHFDVGRESSILALNKAMEQDRLIFLTAQTDIAFEDPTTKELYQVGVVAEIKQIVKSYGETFRVLVEGKYRAKIAKSYTDEKYLYVDAVDLPIKKVKKEEEIIARAYIRAVKDMFTEYASLSPKMPKDIILNAVATEDPVYLVEHITCNIPIEVQDKQLILEESAPLKRLEILAGILESENDIINIERQIEERVKENVDKNQKEYYLREQLKVIGNELGDGESILTETQKYKETIDALNLSEEVHTKLHKEVDRLYKLSSSSQESASIRNYLDHCLELPWNTITTDTIHIEKSRKILDSRHYGMEKVKERVLEQLATLKLAPDMKGQIVCLFGPPGVGKTSIAKSIAQSMDRKFARISLGGVRDEADIRGHRRTYIGSMPGRIMNAIKQSGSKNPVILLDEIDKLGSDFRGDPAAALLEALDSEQNNTFRDHFIELPFDLSGVLFITTANSLATIPAPLRDRMEIIPLTSYTREEKFWIAKKHLIPKIVKQHGLTSKLIKINDKAIYDVIDCYTKEAGVRTLERQLASICRKTTKIIVSEEQENVSITPKNITAILGSKKYTIDALEKTNQIGITNGLAYTTVGGTMLQIEIAIMQGSGKIELTGSLGEVMKESARASVSYIRSNCEKYGIDPNFYKTKDIHIHVPEGAVPKDGPSAGITICTALISALTGIPVRYDVAMTGEMSLRGRVLPIGGLKEKTMAAYQYGIKTVMIPKDNVPDLDEVESIVKENIRFVSVDHIEKVLEVALTQFFTPKVEENTAQTEKVQPIPVEDRLNNAITQ